MFILKKAMLLCSNLKFAHDKGDLPFDVIGTESLTVFADNVLPCVLRAVGALVVEEELASLIDSGKVRAKFLKRVLFVSNLLSGSSGWRSRD